MTRETDKVFSDAVAEVYQAYLVPLIFEPYAADLARRVAELAPRRVLEIAAGTGVATRALALALPPEAAIVATDLNQPMLDAAAAQAAARSVEWRQADALDLPFADATFDVVVCQFGVMFFPDKVRAFKEVRRVLDPGGVFVFNTWDRIQENEFADVVTSALASVFPQDPPRFLARTPHGYADTTQIERDLSAAAFDGCSRVETVAARSRAGSYRDPAIAYCQGTPLRDEIEARAAAPLAQATDVAAEAIAARFGRGPVDGRIQAHVVLAAATPG